jgi:S-adenosyl-L-methionine hydrolase (adenosine-forming)
LLPAADTLGGAVGAFVLTDPRYRLEPVSATFHGRDVFAPAAAHLALGVDAAELGPPIEPDELTRVSPPVANVTADGIETDVLRSDHFGNIQLAATDSGLHGDVVIVCTGAEFDAHVGRTFQDVEEGQLVVYVDSGGHLAIARNGGSARELLQDPERAIVKRKM